jgi:hypothetical protein
MKATLLHEQAKTADEMHPGTPGGIVSHKDTKGTKTKGQKYLPVEDFFVFFVA